MGYYVWMNFNEVRLAESKAGEAVQLLSANGLLDPKKGKNEVDVLFEALECEQFTVSRDRGFIYLDEWSDGERSKSGDEGRVIETLGPLFEAGGTSCGEGEEGERWEYRFMGGRYELGWGTDDCVSQEDRERVAAAWRVAHDLLPAEYRDVLEQALLRADYLRQSGKADGKAA